MEETQVVKKDDYRFVGEKPTDREQWENFQEFLRTRPGIREAVRCLIHSQLTDYGFNFDLEVERPKYNLDRTKAKLKVNLVVDVDLDIDRAMEK